MALKIERITECCEIGEGPHWDPKSQSLYYVDIYGKCIFKYNHATKKISKASVAPKQPSFIIPVDGKTDQFIVSLSNDLAIILWDGESDEISILETLYTGDNFPDTKGKSFNDAKCDSVGRLWTGTYGNPTEGVKSLRPAGSLYSFSSNSQLKEHVDKITVSNGMTFNDQTQKMYYIDTFKGTIDQFDFDLTQGSVSNRQSWFTLGKHGITGLADGMTIDTDGNLWVAIFNGGKIIKIAGDKPETLLRTIDMPAVQVASVTFGGQNLDELYVTTAAIEFDSPKPSPPMNGATYRITGIDARGLPAANFKLD